MWYEITGKLEQICVRNAWFSLFIFSLLQLKLVNSKSMGPEKIISSYPKFELNISSERNLFFSIGVGFSTFRVMVYISYDVDTLYSWFGAFWRMLEHEINNNYETLIERYVCQSNEIWLVIDLWADQWR